MNLREHLSSSQLKAYLQGWLDETSSDSIEQHLAECPECEETLVTLENECDTLVQHLRNAERDGDPKTPPRAGLITPSQLPLRFGAYELQARIGQGGMGSVYQARHLQLNKSFAIKLVQVPERAGNASKARFEREVRAAGGLNHSAIVAATDAGHQDQIHFLAMELIEGHDLGKIARSAELIPVADACEIVRLVADGLAHAHSKGVVHRDIKPSNVMLSRSGEVKILDFGLAQLSKWDDVGVELTTVGQLMGTLDYMAPEQAERPEAVDYRADLYSLGATLFRLLCGRPPLSATPNLSPLAKLRLLANHSPPAADTLRPDLPDKLVDLIARLLASDPNERPASASHVAEQLLPLCAGHDLITLANRPITDAAKPADDRLTAAAHENAPQFAQASQPSIPTRPPKYWRWLAAAALPLLIIAGIVISVQYQKGQLIIESEAALTVNVIQNGKTYDKVKIEPGTNQTKLYAGTYEITIDEASDSFSLDKDTVEIERGDVVIARIRSEPPSVDRPPVVTAQTPAKSNLQTALPSSREPLKPGDRILIVCLADDDLNASAIVMADDTIKARLVGVLSTRGKTVVELEQALNVAYQKYYDNPQIEVFREFPERAWAAQHVAISSRAEDLRALENESREIRSEYGDSHPLVQRGEQQIAEAPMALEQERAAATTNAITEPLYKGKPFSEWLAMLRWEQSPEGLEEAIQAVLSMSKKEDAAEVSKVLLGKLDWLAEQPANKNSDLQELFFGLLERLNSSEQYAVILGQRLKKGDAAVREQALRHGLKIRRFDETVKKDWANIRNWIESEVFQGDENESMVDLCGAIYLRWVSESEPSDRELIEPLVDMHRCTIRG